MHCFILIYMFIVFRMVSSYHAFFYVIGLKRSSKSKKRAVTVKMKRHRVSVARPRQVVTAFRFCSHAACNMQSSQEANESE